MLFWKNDVRPRTQRLKNVEIYFAEYFGDWYTTSSGLLFFCFLVNLSRSPEEMGKRCIRVKLVLRYFSLCTVLLMSISRCTRTGNLQNSSNLVLEIWGWEVSWKFRILHFEPCRFNEILYFSPSKPHMSFRSPLHKTATGDTGMIAGPEQVATEEHSLP